MFPFGGAAYLQASFTVSFSPTTGVTGCRSPVDLRGSDVAAGLGSLAFRWRPASLAGQGRFRWQKVIHEREAEQILRNIHFLGVTVFKR